VKSRKKKILVIDDDEVHLRVTKEMLRDDAFEVMTRQNGFGVMAVVSEFEPDLVLLDMNMPALSGDKIALMLRSCGLAHPPRVIFYSSLDEDSLRENAAACGVRGYICKGDVSDLKDKVTGFLL
jgi:CheY-like chemotaxis protein